MNMFNIFDDQFLDDAVSRAEQSRFSYAMQTEEFRSLNSNLQTYLNDIKRIDDENHQLQDNIEQIRANYIMILESHLKRLPEDFRGESRVLTEAHLERYKSKSRAKRFLNEREELKKRINFLAINEKDQIKHFHNLQRQQRRLESELKILNEQMQHIYHRVQAEKQTHQQAMNKVDQLQIQLEQISIERSRREFEIQTLREEVKLMQTAKEFLDEEHQTILLTQTEANEYFLSRLDESITRIREDFNELNQSQLRQIENEYQQIMKILEDNQTIDETMLNNEQQKTKIEYQQLQNEHQSITQELIILNDLNLVLSEQFLAMEGALYSIRDQQMQELCNKDDEFERNQIELQALNEKLNLFAEYDKNLKFELTLYRGVLESEYRRKQQSNNNQQQRNRPTTLRPMTSRGHRNSLKNLINRNQLEPVIEKIDSQTDETTKSPNSTLLDAQQSSMDIPVADSESSSEVQHTSPTPTVSEDQLSREDRSASSEGQRKVSTPASGAIDDENQLAKTSEEYDNVTTNIFVERSPSDIEPNQIKEKENDDYISTAGYYGTRNDSIQSTLQQLSRHSSHQTSFTDIEGDNTDLIGETGSRSSLRIEEEDEDSDHTNQSNLESVIQDLRYVYRHLINNDDLVEINDDFPDNLIDRLEFRDNLIRTLFDNLVRKYMVQATKNEDCSNTLDWIGFRDILFPILTGRYTEGHLRNLFNLFDVNKTGYLSRQELAELLELLQITNSNELSESMTQENGKLNIDELIESIRKTDDVNKNLLSDEIESKQWYIQHPIDDEHSDTQSLPLEIHALPSPSRTNNGIILLSRIFKRMGANFENRQLDSNKPTLSMRITNDFIHNNVHISNEDLQSFIELYLNKKRTSDHLINWTEFRDVFLPLVNGGMVSKDDVARWFDIFDTNQSQTISSEQLLHLLRLLQVSSPENILNRIHELFPDKTNSWTLAELHFALETIDEITTRLLFTNEQNSSYDLEWLRKNTH